MAVDIDLAPVAEFAGDGLEDGWIRRSQVLQGLVGEHDPEPKGVVGPIALIYRDRVGDATRLEQYRSKEATRPAPDTSDTHVNSLTLLDPMILPCCRSS